MIFAMKRLPLVVLLTILLLPPLFGFSLSGTRVQDQPFDSEEELGKIDFAKPLAENQRKWVEGATVSLLTIGSGDPLYAWFGHTALIVGQPSGGQVMYDYGVFDTEQKNFYLNFARGRMYYAVYESEATWRIQEALDEKRDVKLVELDLTPEATFATIRFLQHNAMEENSTYLYHFYKDNCATRIRDIINAATDGEFRTWAEAQGASGTYRQLAQRYLAHAPVVFWALDFLQGPSIDKPLSRYDQMFLPEELSKAVLDFFPSLAAKEQIVQDTRSEHVRFTAHGRNVNNDWVYALAGIIAASLLFLLGRRFRRTTYLLHALILLALGGLGSILLFMMTFSDMDMTWLNENILLVNPLLLLASFSAFRAAFSGRPGKLAGWLYQLLFGAGILLVVAKGVLPTLFVQDNMKVILLLLPLYLSGAALYRRANGKELQALHP